MKNKHSYLFYLAIFLIFIGCNSTDNVENNEDIDTNGTINMPELSIQEKINEYAKFQLSSDISALSDKQKEIIKLLIEISDIFDEIYWYQTWGNKEELFASIVDPDTLQYIKINYGPWDRLNGNKPIIEKIGKKPLGANYYPSDVKYLPFINMKFEDKLSQFTLLKRDENGELYTVPYHKAYNEQLTKAAELMNKVADISENPSQKKFFQLRAQAFLSDNYYDSDIAWMEINDNIIECVVGPIECDEDRFINTKTAYQSIILLKDNDWSNKMKSYIGFIPELLKNIPIDEKYRSLISGKADDICVYDAIYYKGYANQGGKSISINHPKDGRILMEKGNEKLQFKNVMKAKFDKILYPISEVVIDESQLKHVKFEAFFENNLFYEISDGLTINKTLDNKGTVKDAMKEYYSTINGLKADVLRLILITELDDMGKHGDLDLMDNYVTFVSDIFRSVRFGTSHFQGEGNMVTFNFLIEQGAIVRNNETGKYKIDFEKMKSSLEKLSNDIIVIQGDGNFEAAQELIQEKGFIRDVLKGDLVKISKAGIPRDIYFEQGLDILGIK